MDQFNDSNTYKPLAEITAYLVIPASDILGPVITPGQSANVAEDASVSDPVITVAATDASPPISGWQIIAGNTNNLFAIDSSTGAITVAAALSFDTVPSVNLSVRCQDSEGNVSDTETVTINITEVYSAPTIVTNGGSLIQWPVQENTTFIAVIEANNPNSDGPGGLTFEIDTEDRVTVGAVPGGRPDGTLMVITPIEGEPNKAELSFAAPPDFENPQDYAGAFGDVGGWVQNNNYAALIKVTHNASGLSAYLPIEALVTDVAEGGGGTDMVLAAGTIAPLPTADQTHRASWDSWHAQHAAELTAMLNSTTDGENAAYFGSYFYRSMVNMIITTQAASYIDLFLNYVGNAQAAMVADNAGYFNWPLYPYSKYPTYAANIDANGNVAAAPNGLFAPFLAELQGAQAIETGLAIIRTGGIASAAQLADALTFSDFQFTNIYTKWDVRSPPSLPGVVNQTDPGGSWSGWDQTTQFATYCRARSVITANATLTTYADDVRADVLAQMINSVARGGRVPEPGSQYVNTKGVIADTSHTNRLPDYMKYEYLFTGNASMRQALINIDKHFGSMMWNQSTTSPIFSQDMAGGTPFNSSNVYHGWVDVACVDGFSQAAIDAYATTYTSSFKPGPLAARAGAMASKTLAAAL